MQKLHDNQSVCETAVLVAVDNDEYDTEASLDELKELAKTAGIETLGIVTQKREHLAAATLVGSGKMQEIAEYVKNSEADLVIVDHELTGVQLRNLEQAWQVPVLDRTMLILEIFSQRARSSEGKLQVELARTRYILPRLAGAGKGLSRLGGGGGGGGGARRGKGETKLELDRRHVRHRIELLETQLAELENRRAQVHLRRKKDGVNCVAIVGYTNVGKSTLLNTLTDAGVLAEDKLFATLDPTARALTLPDGRSVMLIDTVGLIRRLPHHLVEAFKSTLEEAVHADLLLNVCDISSGEAAQQAQVTRELINELGAKDTMVLTVLNKCDLLPAPLEAIGDNCAAISARTGLGMNELLEKISRLLPPTQRRLKAMIPYSEGALLADIRAQGKLFLEEFETGGTLIDALVDHKLLHRVAPYILQE